MTGNPHAREIGRVSDADGFQGVIGVWYGTVTIAASPSPVAPVLRLDRAQAEQFAQLFVAACWQAAQFAGQDGAS